MNRKKLNSKDNAKDEEIDYLRDAIKKAIQAKFGTVKRYAEFKGVSEATMSGKISDHTSNFLYELRGDGFEITDSFNKEKVSIKNSTIGDGTALAKLEGQIELLEKQLKEKDAKIVELERKRK